MAQAAVDQLRSTDAAFAGNRLLSTFPPDVRAMMEPHSAVIELALAETVLVPRQHVEQSLFPFDSTMISMVVELDGGRSIEVASVGREGALGGIVSCGNAPAFTRATVQVAGPALRVPMRVLEDAKQRSPFLQHLFCRFSDYLLAQVMQSVPCTLFHSIEQRAALWLLTAQDRGGDCIELTQEALAGLLGVQRTSLNAAIRSLQAQGLIETRRGSIRIVDRAGLKRLACECYSALRAHFDNVIASDGAGGSPDCD